MGGIGKTTMAELLFEELEDKFEYTCLVEELKLTKGSKDDVKEKIRTKMRRDGKSVAKTCTWDDLRGEKLLMVVDDIDEHKHVDMMLGIARDNAMPHSRYLVTSRNAGLLKRLDEHQYGKAHMYEIPFLRDEDAERLFYSYAFPNGERPSGSLGGIVEEIVRACAGLPLTLTVMGSHLQAERDKGIWAEIPSALKTAQSISSVEERMWAVLRVSYDALQDDEKDLFLEMACIFSRDDHSFTSDEIKWALASKYKSANNLLKTLVERCLIKFVHGPLEYRPCRMHEHLRSMGYKIAKDFGRSMEHFNFRLEQEEYQSVLHEKEALKNIASLSVRISERAVLSDACQVALQFLQAALPEMTGLRYLDVSFSSREEQLYSKDETENVESRTRKRFPDGMLSLPASIVIAKFHTWGWILNTKSVAFRFEKLAVLYLGIEGDWLPDFSSAAVCDCLPVLKSLSMSSYHSEVLSLEGLPASFGNLSCLQHLKLQGLSLQELPTSFGNLSNLQHLDMGNLPLQQLPASFGNLSSLQHLELDYLLLQELPASFGNLSSLQYLQLYGVPLQKLPASFGNLSSLQHLVIYQALLQELPASFGNLSSLQHLELSKFSLQELPASVGDLRNLQHLDLYDLPLQELPASFGNLNSLQYLKLLDLPLQELPASYGNLSNLQHLELRHLPLLGLPTSFGNLSNLQHLELLQSSLQELPVSFGNLSSLQYLVLESSFQEVPTSIGNLRSLQHLDLRDLPLQELPASFGNLRSLQHLDLRDLPLQELPASFGNLSNLQYLRITSRLTKSLLQELPASLGNLSSLQHLQLEYFPLGELPAQLGNLSRLHRLELTKLSLEKLPESFGNLSSLQHLELYYSPLQELPESFGNLSNLQYLQLVGLSLQELPVSFGNLSNLQYLRLDGLLLQELPISFGNLSSLQHLELRKLPLQELPVSFTNLSNLRHLELLELPFQKLPASFANFSRQLKPPPNREQPRNRYR
ncbi:hypothetical protein R1sor_003167 [Riccia sorocarpa]|uniref:NB-ARC domain-containing protein n=1 Tax=Riccia sorocarpa TaxID=122646 RepID=A0ABD3H459_9MARC